jgi:hypothetical protein
MDALEQEQSYDLGLGEPWTYSRIYQKLCDSFRDALALQRVRPGEVDTARTIGGLDEEFSEADLSAVLSGTNPLLTGKQLESIGYCCDQEFGRLVNAKAPDFHEAASRRWLAIRRNPVAE